MASHWAPELIDLYNDGFMDLDMKPMPGVIDWWEGPLHHFKKVGPPATDALTENKTPDTKGTNATPQTTQAPNPPSKTQEDKTTTTCQ
jgi:hypothetical protein